MRSFLCIIMTLCLTTTVCAQEQLPDEVNQYLSKYCLECHDNDTQKGDIDLDRLDMNWSDPAKLDLWSKVLWVSEDELMPPLKKKQQPNKKERETFVNWVASKTLEHAKIGGTLPRRLNQTEYQNTIRALFRKPDFMLPVGFPKDVAKHGFNNQGEGLRLSPPLLEAYGDVASSLAEELFPRPIESPKSQMHKANPEDMVISFAAASLRDGVLRLASKSTSTMRGSTWPSRIEILHSGRYRIKVSASKFRPVLPGPMVLEVRARELSKSDRTDVKAFRHLKDIELNSGSPEETTFEAILYEGQTLLFRWKNAEMDHEYNALADLFEARFKKDKRFHAAWLDVMYDKKGKKKVSHAILRGENGYHKIQERLLDDNLDLSPAHPESIQHKAFMKFARSMSATMSIADALAFDYFEHGPALEIHQVSVEGPLEIVDGPKDKMREEKRVFCFGQRKESQSDLEYAKSAIQSFLTKAYRRPAEASIVESYHQWFQQNLTSGMSYDDCFHLLIRKVLVSPRFLYRSLTPGKLDQFDLATRLAYFMTQSPPDQRLNDLALKGSLKNPNVFKEEVKRLMPRKLNTKTVLKPNHHPFVKDFVSQWLHLNHLKDIMPAPKFNFSEKRMSWAKDETLLFFNTMLAENRPMEDFIDPNFTYSTELFVKSYYGGVAKATEKRKEQELQRFEIQKAGRHGGLLGQASVMIVTANGVDTQPVLRGAWILENILGQKVPPPPKDVPALTPDINKAKTPREQLSMHTKDAECMSCHERIDPLGFVFESYNPIGKWRDQWPDMNKKINSEVTLRDGTNIKNAIEFKKWLVENIDLFTQCLSEKILTYATGRELNYTEKHEIAKIVKSNKAKGNRFKDLFYALVESETFMVK